MNDTIRTVLSEHGRLTCPATEIGEHQDLYELGLTSHASVNVMLALEDAFDIEFPEELLRKSTFASIGAISEAVGSITASVAS